MTGHPLLGKTAVVTGGTKGIGLAISRALLDVGMRVMISGRDPGRLAEAQALLSTDYSGERVAGCLCDVGDLEQVRALMAATGERFGDIDVLVNNAGVGFVVPFDQLTVEQWRQTIDTNLTGTFYCCHAALPWLKTSRGQIVNISSRSGKNPFPGGTSYNASKFGVNGFSEALMLDLRSFGIRVSYMMPGRVNTDFASEAPQPWHIPMESVAAAVVHALSADPRVLIGEIDLRPARPPGT